MQKTNERKSLAITALAENFGKEFSDTLLELWLKSLEKYTAQEVEIAVAKVIDSYEYKTLPPLAVIKKFLTPDKEKPEALEAQALAEWTALLHALETNGHYSPPKLHPTTEIVLRQMGGWQAACQWERKHCDFKRRDFIELWQGVNGNEPQMIEGADAMLAKIEAGRRDTTSPAALPEWRQ